MDNGCTGVEVGVALHLLTHLTALINKELHDTTFIMVAPAMKFIVILVLLLKIKGFSHNFNNRVHSLSCNANKFARKSQTFAVSIDPDLPSAAELENILQVAIEAAKKAGVLIRENIGARVKYSKTNYKVRYPLTKPHIYQFSALTTLFSEQDVVTEIDVASQRSIESIIMSNFPKHGFLGEESVEAGHCASVGMRKYNYASAPHELSIGLKALRDRNHVYIFQSLLIWL